MAKHAGHLCHPDSLGLNYSPGLNFPCPPAYTPLLMVLARTGLKFKGTVIWKRGGIMKYWMLVLGLNDDAF